MRTLDVHFTPAELAALSGKDLSRTTCVVFDVLRATSSMLTAIGNGADAIIPVAEIRDAVAIRAQRPEVLLAGERHGLRIRAEASGGVDFDFGNSPREFTANLVSGRTIATTTTNGTRALRACSGAEHVLVGAFLNLQALTDELQRLQPERLLLICAGTVDEAAYEDALAAGAVCDLLWDGWSSDASDGATMARLLFRQVRSDLGAALAASRNGRRLLALPALAEDVAICARLDSFPVVAGLNKLGEVRRLA
jgi:2-phosphosulfolactate phosphatase